MKKLAPIVFFAFNRPEHTLKCLQAIAKNPLAKETDIYIYCDGPRANESKEGLEKIEAVREIALSAKDWIGNSVECRFREKNWGLYNSITAGITEVIEMHEKVIVIEDDILVSPGFLKFMNEALELYKDDERVMHISGFCPFSNFPIPYQETTFFYNHTYCWGWGTWSRAWKYYNFDGYDLMKKIKKSGKRKYFNLDGTFEFYWGLKFVREKQFHDWNYNWYASVTLQNGFCLHPVKPLVNNIGFDGSGTHCDHHEVSEILIMTENVDIKKIPVKENKDIRAIIHQAPWRKKAELYLKHIVRSIVYPLK